MGDRKQPTPSPEHIVSGRHGAYVAAFETWENEFRADPGAFMTDAEQAAMDVLPLSEQRAACFEAILNRLVGAHRV